MKSILKALAKVEINMDGASVFHGSVVGLIRAADSGNKQLEEAFAKPPVKSLEILVGGLYDIRMFRDKTTIAMDTDMEELQVVMGMACEAVESWGGDEFKSVSKVFNACIPTRIEGSYRAIYPDGEVIVEGSQISGHITFPFGLDDIHEEIARQERNFALLNAADPIENGVEGTDGQ